MAVAVTERDMTELKAAQTNLKAFNEELERRVAERTELAEQRAEQLRQLSLDLSRAEENERRRIAQVLHDDLQQILAAARMALSRAQRDTPENMAQGFAHVSELLEQALGTTRDLSHEISPPILQEGLLPALQWVRRWCGEKHQMHIRIKADPAAEPASPELRYLLFAASRELLFNVVKHAGTDRAEVALDRTDQGIRLIVKDEGRGFNPDDLEHAERTDAGFGLLSLRERVRSLGGEVQVASQDGRGAQVTIVVPEAPAPLAAEPAPPAAAAESQAVRAARPKPSAAGSIIRVLLVDDHQVMRNGLASLLQFEPGIEVVSEADSGETAIQMVERDAPDLVLMDVTMPGIGGVEATRRITTRFPHVAVVGLSMHDPVDRASAMTDAGAIAYVQKSAPAQELIDAVRAAVRQRRG